jgi:predicted secreted hydrolase
MRLLVSIFIIGLSRGIAFGADAAFSTSPAPDFAQVLEPRAWLFPRDHGRHDGYKTEWWYFTGNLRDKTGRRFGYQLTFFRTAVAPNPTTRPSPWAMRDLYFAHAAISDPADNRFLFKDRMQRGRAGLAESSDQTMDVFLLDWSAKLDARGNSHLIASEPGFGIDLIAGRGVGPVLQGPGGVNKKGRNPGQASYYYSQPLMPTTGSLTIDSQTFQVQGQTWMDHEFSSNALSSDQVGWDWLALSMNDHSSLMIYRLRNRAGGTDFLSGTLIAPDGKPKYLGALDITFNGEQAWTSPQTGAVYPQVWHVAVPGREPLVVRTVMTGQELITRNSTNVNYFEGMVDATNEGGKTAGEGYLEMTGHSAPLTGGK